MRSDAGCVIGTSFRAQHDRHLARLVNERQVLDGISPNERHGEKEPQCCDRTVDGRWADVGLGQVQLEKTQWLYRVNGKMLRFLAAWI